MGQGVEIVDDRRAAPALQSSSSPARQVQGLPELVISPEESPLLQLNGPDIPRASIRAELLRPEQGLSHFEPQLDQIQPDALHVQIVLGSDTQAKPGLLRQFIDKLRKDTLEVTEFVKFASQEYLPKWLSDAVVAGIDFTLGLPKLFKNGMDYLGEKANSCWEYVCKKCSDAKDWALEFIAPAIEWASKAKDSIKEFLSGDAQHHDQQLKPHFELAFAAKDLTSAEKKLSSAVHMMVDPPDERYSDSMKASLKILEVLNEFAEVLRHNKKDDKVQAETEQRQFEEKRKDSLGNIAQAIASHPECADFIRARVQSAYAQAGLAYDDMTDGELSALIEASHAANKPPLRQPHAVNITDVTAITNARSSRAA